jgi:hypothetical protein
MTVDGTPSAHYEDEVASGKFDGSIDTLCRGIRDLGHPVILRIGYEFNGEAWNGYKSESYKAAFRRIARKIRDLKLECATCWDASANAGTLGNVMDFYPGDEWVDWWGINLFLPSEFTDPAVGRFMADARARGKPVLIGESTPRSVGVLKGASSWKAWFRAVLRTFIAAHPGVKVSRTSLGFAKYPQCRMGHARGSSGRGRRARGFPTRSRALVYSRPRGSELRSLARGYGTPNASLPSRYATHGRRSNRREGRFLERRLGGSPVGRPSRE